MRFFRKDAPARSAAADPWQAVKITCQEAFVVRPERSGIEDPATAARDGARPADAAFPRRAGNRGAVAQAARRWNSAADRALEQWDRGARPHRSGPPLVGLSAGTMRPP